MENVPATNGPNGLFSQSLDRLKESFLFAAAQGGNSQDVQSLLDIGADIDWRGQGGDTALLAACRRGHCETMAMLSVHGSDVNVVANDGATCLHIAARRGDIASVNVLLEADCIISIKDKEGRTAMDIARSKAHDDIVARLVQYQRIGSDDGGRGGSSSAARGIRGIVRQAQSEDKAVAAAVINSPRGRTPSGGVGGGANSNLPNLSSGTGAGAVRPGSRGPNQAGAKASASSDSDSDSKITTTATSSTSALASALGVDLNAAPKSSIGGGGGGAKADPGQSVPRSVPAPTQSYALIGSAYADATTAALSKLLETEQRERKLAAARAAILAADNARLEEDLTRTLDEASMLASELACVKRELDLIKGKRTALEAPSVTLETCAELDRILKGAIENVEARKSALLMSSLTQQQEQRLCVVCQERDKSVVLLPCRHLCLCEACSGHDDLAHCPLCRRPIAHRISVFS